MKKLLASAFLSSAFVFACGGGGGSGNGSTGSGVDGDALLVDLDDGELTDICEYLAELATPTRTVDCDGEPLTIEAQPIPECVANLQGNQDGNPDCDATVDEFEACAEAVDGLSDDELCNLSAPPAACAPLATPQCGGGT